MKWKAAGYNTNTNKCLLYILRLHPRTRTLLHLPLSPPRFIFPTETTSQFNSLEGLNLIQHNRTGFNLLHAIITSWCGRVQGASGSGRVDIRHLRRICQQDLAGWNGLGMGARLASNWASRHDVELVAALNTKLVIMISGKITLNGLFL